MSDTVDTRAVEMRFDNSNFEKNAKQSISTLKDLESALELKGASAGLQEIEKASENLNFKDLTDAVDKTGQKFNALAKIAEGALYKIGMWAAEAGAKMVKSLTWDQLAAGWNKYAQKTEAVQTIMANLRDEEGAFIDEASKMSYVENQLDKLIWFSDETSYKFTEMTSNVGKFIANGAGLEESVVAMQGISTWAASAGQRANGAARAMYNISQAMGVGSMKIRDWMSIENANMATAQFKELAIMVGQEKGKIKEGQVTIENFRESLSGKDTNGWFDKETMMEVFTRYGEAASKIQEYAKETGMLATEIVRGIQKGDKQLLDDLGITADSLSFKAFKAAQEAKTFGEVVEATADAVSTKWMRIFQNIFGNYLQAKDLWTDLSEDLWEIFAGPLDTLNEIMTAWNRGFLKDGPKNIIQEWFASGDLDKLDNELTHVSKSLAEYYAATKKSEYAIRKLEDGTRQLVYRTKDAQGQYKYYTKEIYEEDKDLLSGRELLIDGFRNILRTFLFDWEETNNAGRTITHKSIFTTIKDALKEVVFGTSETEEIIPKVTEKLYGLTKQFHDFSLKLVPSNRTLNKIKDSFKGLFSLFKIGGKLVSPLFNAFNKYIIKGFFSNNYKKPLLSAISSFGIWLQKLEQYLDEIDIFETASAKISGWFKTIKGWIDSASISLIGMPIKDFFKNIYQSYNRFIHNYDFESIFGGISKSFNSITTQIQQFKTGELPEKLTVLQKFLVGMSKVFSVIKTIFGGVTGAVASVFDQIRKLKSGNTNGELSAFQVLLSGMGGALKFVKAEVSDFITSFPKFIQRIKSFKFSDLKEWLTPVKDFWGTVKTFVKSSVDSIFGIGSSEGISNALQHFQPIINFFKSILQGFAGLLDTAGPYIESAGKWIGGLIGDLGNALKAFVGNKSGIEVLESLADIFEKLAAGKLLNSIAKLNNRFSGVVKVFSGILKIFKKDFPWLTGRKTVGKAIIEDLGAVKDILKAYKREINIESLIDFSIAVGALSASLWILSKVPADRLQQLGVALAQIAGVAAVFYALEKIFTIFQTLADARKYSKITEAKEIIGPIDAIKDVLTAVVRSSIFANDATAKFLKLSAGMVLIAIAMKKITSSLVDFGNAVVSLGKNYSEPDFMNGLKIIGLIAAGLAVFSLISSLIAKLGGVHPISLALRLAAFVVFLSKAKEIVGNISELGTTTDKGAFFKGLGYIQWLLASFTFISIAGWISGSTKLSGMVYSLLLVLALTRYVRIIAQSLTDLAKGTTPAKLTSAKKLIESLTQTIGATIGILSLIQLIGKRRSILHSALAIVAMTLAIKTMINAVLSIARSASESDIAKATKIVNGLLDNIRQSIDVIALIGGSKFTGITKKGGFSYSFNGKKGLFWGAFAFVGIAWGIKMMCQSVMDVAKVSNPGQFDKAIDSIKGILEVIRVMQPLITAVSGFNFKISGKKGGALYSGVLGTIAGAAGFIAVCYGITLMAEALALVASFGDTEAIGKAGEVIKDVLLNVGIVLGGLAIIGGIDVGGLLGSGLVVFSPTVGMIVGGMSFTEICDGLKVIAESLEGLASVADNTTAIDNGVGAFKKILWTVFGITALLGLVGGINYAGIVGPGIAVFSTTAGMYYGSVSFTDICGSVKVIGESLTGLASNGLDTNAITEGAAALKSVLWTVFGITALLGVVGSLKVDAGVLEFSPSEGMVVGGTGLKTVCDGATVLAGSLKDLSQAGNTESIAKAGEILESMTTTTGWITALVGVVGGLFGDNTSVGAEAFSTISDGVWNLSQAIAELSKIDYSKFSEQSLNDLERVVNIATSIFTVSLGEAVFVSASDMQGKAGAFNNVVDSVKGLLEKIVELSSFAEDNGDITSSINALERVINATTGIFKINFGEWFSSNETIGVTADAKTGAFNDVADSVKGMLRTIVELSKDAKDAGDLGSSVTALKDVISVTTGIFSISFADWFTSADNLASAAGAKTDAFVNVSGSVTDMLKVIVDMAKVAKDAGDVTPYINSLKSVITATTDIFSADFWKSTEKTVASADAKASAFERVAKPINELLKTISELPKGLIDLDGEAGKEMGAYITEFVNTIVASYITALEDTDAKNQIKTKAESLESEVQHPFASAITDAVSWGYDIGVNLANGMNTSAEIVQLAATNLAGIIKSILGFSEPEEGPLSDFHTYAPDMIKLWCKGIYDNADQVTDSGEYLANSVGDSFSTALEYVSNLIDNGMTDQLTVRPVMDLSEIQNGIHSMNGLFAGNNGFQIVGTTRLAASAAYGLRSQRDMSSTNPQSVGGDSGVTNNTFYITNNDPNAVADKVSKILRNQTTRQKAVWDRK